MKCSECGNNFTPEDREQDVCEDCQAEYSREIERLKAVIAEMTEALTSAACVLGDALALGQIRYREDVGLSSPWPEMRECEKQVSAVLARHRGKRGTGS